MIAFPSIVFFYAIRNPAMFPLGLYALLVPFDNVLGLSTGTTLTHYLGVLLILSIWLNRIIIGKGKFRKPPAVVWGWLTFLILAGLSLLWAVEPARTLHSLYTLGGLFLIYLSSSIIPVKERDYQRLMYFIVVGGLIASAVSILSFARGLTYEETLRASLVIATERREDPNEFATSLILPLMLALGWLVTGTNKAKRLFGGVFALVMLTAIVLTGSRGGMLGALAGLTVLVTGVRGWHTRLKLISIGLIVVLALFIIPLPSQLVVRFSPTNVMQSGGAGRLAIWQVGWSAFLERPFAGYGYDNFAYAYELFRMQFPQTGYFIREFQVAHNIYLQALVELGILGGVILAFTIWHHWISLGRIKRVTVLHLALRSTLAGVSVASLTLNLLSSKSFWLVFTVTAMMISLSRSVKEG